MRSLFYSFQESQKDFSQEEVVKAIQETIDWRIEYYNSVAIAALREDSDYMQWFTDGKDWYKHMAEKNNSFLVRMKNQGFHKASLEELIEHFKEDI